MDKANQVVYQHRFIKKVQSNNDNIKDTVGAYCHTPLRVDLQQVVFMSDCLIA